MSYFRNMSKVVSSHLFAKNNNFVLPSCFRKVNITSSQQATIEYIHSAKALVSTIQELEAAKGSGPFEEDVSKELAFLEWERQNYSLKIREFVVKGGLLTGQGIANAYYSADKMALTAEWLDKNIHHSVPLKIRFMSRENLLDTIQGLKKYHSDSPYLSELQQELSNRPQGQPEEVSHLPNETTRFQYSEKKGSNNLLVNAIRNGSPAIRYRVESLATKILKPNQYALHSE